MMSPVDGAVVLDSGSSQCIPEIEPVLNLLSVLSDSSHDPNTFLVLTEQFKLL